MNSKIFKTTFMIAALVAYNFLFWQEKFGINLMLFTILLCIYIVSQNKESVRSPKVILLLIAVILTGFMVSINNSGISKFTHIFSFLVLSGFVHEQKMRSLYFAFANVFVNFFLAPVTLTNNIKSASAKIKGVQIFFFYLKLFFIPLLIISVFYLLYANANSYFSEFFSGFWNFVNDLLKRFFENVSILKILFLLTGVMIITGTTAKKYFSYFLSNDLSYSDFLKREKMSRSLQTKQTQKTFFSFNGLTKELKAGIVLIAALNLLILVLNFIDIKLLWFGFYAPNQFSMKNFVHEGTYFLIISILISMIIVLYFFRKNLNFYSKNKLLKYLSYFWIFQNIILCISVCIRNQYYIFYDGLAYRRIGLFAFLIVTIFGLLTLVFKIKKLKSFYYLLRINTWSVYIIMIFLCFFNWDMIIAKTNINHWNGSGIDMDFYLRLSPETYPLIYANLDKIEKQMRQHKMTGVIWVKNLDINKFKNALDHKRDAFLSDYRDYSWVSWNHSDQAAYHSLTQPEFKKLSFKK
ncbi:MAG TPA: DUF4173 domain-containing protein [Bacteroidia bacterium]|nr:DUF4173 domain-containing protein [Bacteroidia bacterium]